MARVTKADEQPTANTEENATGNQTLSTNTDPYALDANGYICGDLWKVQPIIENEKVVGWEQATKRPERTNVKLNVAQVMEINGAIHPGQKNPLMIYRKDGVLFEGQR